MQPEYRQTITNFELSKAEARTLSNARIILADMLDWIDTCNCECDADLKSALQAGVDGLNKANARLNVNTRLEEED